MLTVEHVGVLDGAKRLVTPESCELPILPLLGNWAAIRSEQGRGVENPGGKTGWAL
jgi:hypothetical protein